MTKAIVPEESKTFKQNPSRKNLNSWNQSEIIVCRKYHEDAQRMFSRVQHHVHEKTKKGYIPLGACMSKKSKGLCKHDFPMEKRLTKRLRIICQGNAKRFGLRIKGKRNQLGMTLGKRTDVWQSGTAMVFAVFCRSNTHTAPNYRMPPLDAVHDDEFCKKSCFSKPGQKKITCKLAQRAQREATGYFCGYSFKRQAVGKFVLRATAESLNYVELGLHDKSAGRQWYRTCNRMITDLNHRCTMRTAPEEFNLAANNDKHDHMNAEFIRSYRAATFPGVRFVRLLESELNRTQTRVRHGFLPVRAEPVNKEMIRTYHLEEIYGYRGCDERVYRLSPWEFVMFWEVYRVPTPKAKSDDGLQVNRTKMERGMCQNVCMNCL